MLAHALAHTVQADRGDVVLRAGIMAAADLDADAREVLRHPAGREDLRHGASQAFGGGDPETASIRARTGDDVLHQLGARISQAVLDQLLVQGLHAGFRHPSNDEVLIDSGPEVAVRIGLSQVGHHVHLRRSDITHRKLDDHGGIAWLLLGHDIGPLPHLVGGLLVERGLGRLSVPRRPVPLYHTCHTGGLRPGRHDQGDGFVLVLKQSDRLAVGAGVAHADIGFLPTPLELLKAQLLDDELHPGLVPVLAVAERIEDLDHGLDRRDQIVHRDELAQDLADAGSGPESAADGHPEADSPVVTASGQQADVVNGGQGAVVAAAGEGDLELSGQALVERIAQQVQCDGFRVRRHVEHLALADSRQVAGGHVAHRVGAGFTGRDADFGEPAHDGAHVLEQGEMELDVLARGNVADSGGVGVGHLGDATQLIRR